MTQSAIVLSFALAATLAAPTPQPATRKLPPPAPAPAQPWVVKIGNPGHKVRLILEGRVLDPQGRPRRDVRLMVWHANTSGLYYANGRNGPLLCSGKLRTNVLGEYRIETELPGMAEGNPHVHFALEDPGTGFRYETLNLARASGPGTDEEYERLPWMITLPNLDYWTYVAREDDGALHAYWDIQLAKTSVEKEAPEGWAAK